jgi:hypothetical protein
MKTAFESLAIRLFLVALLLAMVSSASADGQWEYSVSEPDEGVYSEEDPNGNGGVDEDHLEGYAYGSGTSGSFWAWLDIWADAEAKAWADVEQQYNQPPVRAEAWGWGYGHITGYITWTGGAGQGGNKTCDFSAIASGWADGESSAYDLTSGGYASASADSESKGTAESDKASGHGWATFSESCSYSSPSGGSLSGSSNGSGTKVEGTGTASGSGYASWTNGNNRVRATWNVSLSGQATGLTGGTVTGKCYAEAKADVEAYVSPGTISYWTNADAEAHGLADSDVSMNLY